MSFGKKKKVEATPVQSQFQGVQNYTVGLDGFGSATANRNGDSINTQFQLAAPLQGLQSQATQGLSTNLAEASRPLDQQLSSLQAGNNPYYNMQAEQNRLANESAMADLQRRFGRAGLVGSTAFGGFAAQQANDARLQDLATQEQALSLGNQQAQQAAALNSGVLDQIYSYSAQPTELASNNLMSGFQSADSVALANAQNKLNADIANQQAALQRRSALGSILSAGLSLATIPFTGGGSLAGLAGLGAARATAGGLGALAAPGFSAAPLYSPFSNFGLNSNPFLGRTF